MFQCLMLKTRHEFICKRDGCKQLYLHHHLVKAAWKSKERKRKELVTEKLKKRYRLARAERETEKRQKRLDRKIRQQTAEK